MKYQPNRNYNSNDEVMTPFDICKKIVNHLKPSGVILEPCCGEGNFLRYLPKETLWCEINKGKDFFEFTSKVDWVITNPPWSKIKEFLKHSMEVSDNVAFLVTVNHLWTKARIRMIEEQGFGIKEIILLDMPKEFPQSGFQLGVIYIQRGYKGMVKIGPVEDE